MDVQQNDRIREIINDLKNLRLSSYPRENILNLFAQVYGNIPIVVATVHPNRIIVRGQIYDPKADYTFESRHSYKPVELNTTYQRASVPSRTAFYGSVTSLDHDNEEPLARVTIISEIGKILEDETVTQEEYVFSSWEVLDELNLVAIIQSHEYPKACNFVKEIRKDYETKFCNFYEREFMDYIASEFAKKDIKEDYEYMISAWYSQIIYDSCYDGVAYPSVKMGGAGMNVAIKPESVNEKLKLIGASKFKFIKKEKLVSEDENVVTIIKAR